MSGSTTRLPTRQARPPVRVGDFYADGRVLFEVLIVDGETVLVEDALTLITMDLRRAHFTRMTLVRRGSG